MEAYLENSWNTRRRGAFRTFGKIYNRDFPDPTGGRRFARQQCFGCFGRPALHVESHETGRCGRFGHAARCEITHFLV